MNLANQDKLNRVKEILKLIEISVKDHLEDENENQLAPVQLIESAIEIIFDLGDA